MESGEGAVSRVPLHSPGLGDRDPRLIGISGKAREKFSNAATLSHHRHPPESMASASLSLQAAHTQVPTDLPLRGTQGAGGQRQELLARCARVYLPETGHACREFVSTEVPGVK